MIAKVTSINIEQDRFWLVGGDGLSVAVYVVLQLSEYPNTRVGDRFVLTVKKLTPGDVGQIEEKGGDDEC